MSQLHVRAKGYAETLVNVQSFTSPMFASTNSSQLPSQAAHFPVKANQPNIRFDVIWRGWNEYKAWQEFVRKLQKDALKTNGSDQKGQVTLWWPERNIENWTGLIKSTDAGDERFNWTPHDTIEVELIKSLISTPTSTFSIGSDFWAVVGPTDDLSAIGFKPPTAPVVGNNSLTAPSQSVFNDFLNQVASPTAPNASSGGMAGSVGSLFPQAVQ